METIKSSKNGALCPRNTSVLKPEMVSLMRRSLAGGGRDVTAPCSRANLRPGLRNLLDRNAVEVVDPDAPDVAVVVLGGDVSNPLRSPPLEEQATQTHPRHVELPSEEDIGVETPPEGALHPLTDHNYRLTVKLESESMLSDVDDGPPAPPAAAVLRVPSLTVQNIQKNVDDEDEEVDVEIEDDVEAAMSALFGESPERPALTPSDAVKSEPMSSPEPSRAVSEAGSVSRSVSVSVSGSPVSAPSRGDGTRPGWRDCPICGVAVMGIMGYRDHMLARHLRQQPYRCLECWKTFSLAKDLIRHTNNNCAVVMYKCQRCDRTWSSDVHHAACEACAAAAAAAGGDGPEEDKDSVYECATCAHTFPLLRHLMAHVKTHPKVAKPFKCHTCGSCFNASVRLMIHVRAHTLSPSKKTLASSRPRAPAPSPAPKRARIGAGAAAAGGRGGSRTPPAPPPALAYANPAFARHAYTNPAYANPTFILKVKPPEPHSDDEFGDQAVPLNDDDFHDDIFKDAVGFDDEDDDGAEDWDEDDEDFDGSENQEAMMSEVVGGTPPGPASWKRYKCKVCPRTFRFSHQAGIHMRTHMDERPYACRLCDTTYRQSSHLKRHLSHNHGLSGPAAAQAFRSMIALKKRRLQRERFRALTAFFAKQGGFKGFGPSAEGAAEADLLMNRGFDKDLSGTGKAGKKTRDDYNRSILDPAKPWIKLGPSTSIRPNIQRAPAAAGASSAPAPSGPTSAPTPCPAPAPAPAANGRPATAENGMPS
ncbi:Zinc finger protein 75A [Frankliniella fusca]|uniref:Zinc finger protein 75A n=1 Tax=Frankliniella fusca TaxID=407009 RepID=A0AAE1LLZ3_9NEOP|nr:Zinc finger protein 75A [Frankliniella fusca]